MILLIDASNIRGGGGVTHLFELLNVADPYIHGFDKVIVLASKSTLLKLKDMEWLVKVHIDVFEKHFIVRALWQRFCLARIAKKYKADVLFVPGGSFSTSFEPIVTISQNLLPFMFRELFRYKVSFFTLKLLLLRIAQSLSFKKADGVIFLTQYAKSTVVASTGVLKARVKTIPHGINPKFFISPKKQFDIVNYSDANPFKLLYVSVIDAYKHQWHVAHAIKLLRAEGLPISIDFVGPANPKFLPLLEEEIGGVDYIKYKGAIDFNELHKTYEASDAFVYASSCENLPNILIEAMAAGLPIVCSNKGPMPEVLGDAGVYFDPESPNSIADAIKLIFQAPQIRCVIAELAYQKATCYSWHRCADQTFSFLRDVALSSNVK